ncbi:hypothetical protein ACCD10_10475 [Pseudomonas sp. Pseusp122]|uniref:hypothetical protein n=1 Tax=unclassified Pseudomonas TaxID=196821 RepID=UPI0039A63F24
MMLSFDRKRGGAWMRGWKNWALSVDGATLPTAVGARLARESVVSCCEDVADVPATSQASLAPTEFIYQ